MTPPLQCGVKCSVGVIGDPLRFFSVSSETDKELIFSVSTSSVRISSNGNKVFGNPYILPNQWSTIVSSSVHAGLAAHEKPTTPKPLDNMSARIDGYALPAGKYAWNFGCCQCVNFIK